MKRILFLLSLGAILGCGMSGGDGGLNLGIQVKGLTADQQVCMGWSLWEDAAGDDDWVKVDERTVDDGVCGGLGEDLLTDFATCHAGHRFLVVYNLAFFNASGAMLSSASATSGGGPDDLCVASTDTDSRAMVQLQNEGDAGGVNPGLEVDQVCSNDKLELENGQLVSALWMQAETCTGGAPDSFCVLATGTALHTVRTGITSDGLTRYIFSTSPPEQPFQVAYLSFDRDLPEDELVLINAPWLVVHQNAGGVEPAFTRIEAEHAVASWSYQDGDARAVGFVALYQGNLIVAFDDSAACDAGLALDGHMQVFPAPCGDGPTYPLGAYATGGTGFDVLLSCGAFHCDARLGCTEVE